MSGPAGASPASRRRWLNRLMVIGGGLTLAAPSAGQAPAPAGGTGLDEARAPELPSPGARLALPDVDLLESGRFRAADAQGQVLVLYWWASWCPFCAQQTPAIQALWDKQRSRGLMMLGLSVDRQAHEAREYRRRKGYTFPSALVTASVQRMLPKPRGLPITVVVGRDGLVRQAERGQIFPEDVEALARWLG